MAISEYLGYQELYNHLSDHRLKTPDEDNFDSYIKPVLTFLDCFGFYESNRITIKQTANRRVTRDCTLKPHRLGIEFRSGSHSEPLFVLDYWPLSNELRITDGNGDWDEWQA